MPRATAAFRYAEAVRPAWANGPLPGEVRTACHDAESDHGQRVARRGSRGGEAKGLMGYGTWMLHRCFTRMRDHVRVRGAARQGRVRIVVAAPSASSAAACYHTGAANVGVGRAGCRAACAQLQHLWIGCHIAAAVGDDSRQPCNRGLPSFLASRLVTHIACSLFGPI